VSPDKGAVLVPALCLGRAFERSTSKINERAFKGFPRVFLLDPWMSE